MRSGWAVLDSAARLIPAAGSRMVLATHPGQDPPWLCMSCPCRSVTPIPHAYGMPGAYCTTEPSASLPGSATSAHRGRQRAARQEGVTEQAQLRRGGPEPSVTDTDRH